jgi:apolipoprotein N-acyltransferase
LIDIGGLWLAQLVVVFLVSPLAGVILASIASARNRGWLLLAAAWIATLAYVCWDLYMHPPII